VRHKVSLLQVSAKRATTSDMVQIYKKIVGGGLINIITMRNCRKLFVLLLQGKWRLDKLPV